MSCLPVYEDANCGCAETVACDCNVTLAVHPLHLKQISFEVKFWGQIKRRAASYEVKARKLMKPWCCSSFNDLTASILRKNCSCESVLLDEMLERVMTEVTLWLSGAFVESVNMSLGQTENRLRTCFISNKLRTIWQSRIIRKVRNFLGQYFIRRFPWTSETARLRFTQWRKRITESLFRTVWKNRLNRLEVLC